jgi:hypothetical protein
MPVNILVMAWVTLKRLGLYIVFYARYILWTYLQMNKKHRLHTTRCELVRCSKPRGRPTRCPRSMSTRASTTPSCLTTWPCSLCPGRCSRAPLWWRPTYPAPASFPLVTAPQWRAGAVPPPIKTGPFDYSTKIIGLSTKFGGFSGVFA